MNLSGYRVLDEAVPMITLAYCPLMDIRGSFRSTVLLSIYNLLKICVFKRIMSTVWYHLYVEHKKAELVRAE